METKKMTVKSLLQFVVCGIGGFAIFYVLFSRASFYRPFILAMDVTDGQFGTLYAVYGWIATATYFIGGILADKVPPRIMMFLSFLGTGICNFVLGLFPSYGVCMVLYACMGITTTVTFWAAMLKCVRIFGRNIGNENRAFSWLETLRGIASIAIGTLIVVLFNQFTDVVQGLRFVIWCYAGLLIILAFVSLAVFDKGDEESEMREAAEQKARERILSKKSPVQLFVELIKDPDLWLAIAVAFGGYNIGSCLGSYVGDIAGEIFGVSIAVASYIGLINNWCKPIGAFFGSFVTRKKGPSFILEWTTWIYLVIVLIFIFMPKEPQYLWLFISLMAIEIICTGAFRSQKFIQIKEANIPVEKTGTAFGIISTVIYTSDAFMPTFIGNWLDQGDPVKAYNNMYYVLVASAVLTLVAVLYWRYRHRDNIKALLAEEAQAEAARKANA